MVSLNRYNGEIFSYFICQKGKEDNHLFNDARDRSYLIELIQQSSLKHKSKILAYVLSKNLYALLVQVSHKNQSHFIHHINSGYANYYNRHHNTKHRLFGEHYTYFIIDEKKYLAEVSFYFHLLPHILKEAKSLLRYRWSSLPGYIDKEKKEDWIDYDCVLNHIKDEGGVNPTAYKTRLICRMREKMKTPFIGLKRGEILGDSRFKKEVQDKLNLEKSIPSKNDLNLAIKIIEVVYQEQCFTSLALRNAAIYFIKKYTDLSNHDISLLFKPLKKSSISQMSRRYRNFYETEPSSRKAADRLEYRIREIALKEQDIESSN